MCQCSYDVINNQDYSDEKFWQPWTYWLKWWFCCDYYTAMAQAIVSFTIGVLFSPWSSGIFWLSIYIIINEILTYAFTKGDPRYFNSFVRCAVVCSSLLGYICGRTLAQKEIIFCHFN